jgi:hypothetical protein
MVITPLSWPAILGSQVFLTHGGGWCEWQVSQMLRVVSFMATQLPGPNYHCREVKTLCPQISFLWFWVQFLKG